MRLSRRPVSMAAPTISPFVTAMSWGAMWYRVLSLVFTMWSVSRFADHIIRAWLAVGVFALMAAWTAFCLVDRRVSVPRIGIEVLIVVIGLIASGWIYPDEVRAEGVPTLAGIWSASPVLAAAVVGGARLAVATATFIGLVDIIEPRVHNESTIGAVLQLLMLGLLMGWALDVSRQMHRQLVVALAAQERLAERDRINRAVHDGVLQTLAYIHRRGHDIGGEAAVLGDLAEEQERGLRALMVTAPDIDRLVGEPPTVHELDERPVGDVGAALVALAAERERVEVVRPAVAVRLPEREVREIRDAVGACLDNVAAHAGPRARAWVLLEDLEDCVTVTVRDDGVGIVPGRLEEASAQGRLGVVSSIRGRIEDLGGTATWTTTPERGCTVHLTVPRR